MTFKDVIARWGRPDLARALGLPTKNIQRWWDFDSIPADWFAPVVRVAVLSGHDDISVELLAQIAEERRLTAKARTSKVA